jgi:hypothetical protein
MKNGIIAITMVIAGLTSCTVFIDCIEGNGNVETESRNAVPFSAIANTTSFHVEYIKGDEYSISVKAESNILPYIETEITGGSLEIRTTSGTHCLRYTEQPVITITAPSVSDLVCSGSGDVVADGLEGDDVRVVASGSGDIITGAVSAIETTIVISGSGNVMTGAIISTSLKATLTGSGDLTSSGITISNRYVVSGSGSIFSRDLLTGSEVVTMTGSGSVYTTVNDHLEGVISGSGNLYLQGDPTVNITRSGSGRLIYL